MDYEIISSIDALKVFLDALPGPDDNQRCLFVDLEGDNLSRHGSLSLVTILVEDQTKVHMIDVTTLRQDAFMAATAEGRTLKRVLESKDTIKVFFDIRNDSDALFALFGIRMAGVEDLQLMELASRDFSKRCVNGLANVSKEIPKLGNKKDCSGAKSKMMGAGYLTQPWVDRIPYLRSVL
ncbi:hypothetical protein MRB53_038314 [Persea americana]|nr:hypothetical protein MRB53_038314 [Persea americana]